MGSPRIMNIQEVDKLDSNKNKDTQLNELNPVQMKEQSERFNLLDSPSAVFDPSFK